MDQITSSLAPRASAKPSVAGVGGDPAGSVTKRCVKQSSRFNRIIPEMACVVRLSNELMTLMVSEFFSFHGVRRSNQGE